MNLIILVLVVVLATTSTSRGRGRRRERRVGPWKAAFRFRAYTGTMNLRAGPPPPPAGGGGARGGGGGGGLRFMERENQVRLPAKSMADMKTTLRACFDNAWRSRLARSGRRLADRKRIEKRCEDSAPVGSNNRSHCVRRVAG